MATFIACLACKKNLHLPHFHRAKHYLHSGVARQFRRLIVDRYDRNWDGDREAPAFNLISRGRECKTVLCALRTVMHVVDLSEFHLRRDKKGASCHSTLIMNHTWVAEHRIKRSEGWTNLKGRITFYSVTVSLNISTQRKRGSHTVSAWINLLGEPASHSVLFRSLEPLLISLHFYFFT